MLLSKLVYMPFSSYSVACRSPVTSGCSQVYTFAVPLYLAEIIQSQGIYKADHAQLCQEVGLTQPSFHPPHPHSSPHVRQGSQESMEERSLPQLIYPYGYQRNATAQRDYGLD